MEKEGELAANSLGIGESIVMGVAGAAPAFSVSVVTATLVATVGTLAPASILYCGIIMFGITLAFIHLNKIYVNAGASYAWVSKIFGRNLGFFAGWALLVSASVFMVSGTIPASTATLLLMAPQLVNDPVWVTAVAAFWLTAIALVTLKGIKLSSYVQLIMTLIEVLILVAIIVAGFYRYTQLPARELSLSWFAITGFTPHLFATGALSAVFLYWGWDVTLNLNEETQNNQHAPGWGAFWSVLIVILLFVCFSVAVLLVLSDTEIQSSGTNVIFVLADKIFPQPWGYLAIISVILSTAGTLETNILQFTRTLFAKGRDGVMHSRYARLHKSWRTPWVSILFIWFFGMVFLLLSSNFSTVAIIIKDSVNAIGLQVAFYYSLTGLACAWYYRFIWKNLFELFVYVIWPTLSALFLISIAGFSIPTFDWVTNMVGFGGLLLGFIPFVMNRRANARIKLVS